MRKIASLIVATIVCISVLGVLYIMALRPVGEEVGKGLPRLMVCENKLLDEENNVVILRGVSIADPYFLDYSDNRFVENVFAELSTWNVNVVRVPIHPGAWRAIGGENYCEMYLDQIVNWAEKYGFYIILDWHGIGNPITGVAQSGTTWGHPQIPLYDSDPDLWRSAWMSLAERYGDDSWVIFELFNEPAAVDEAAPKWSEWRTTLEGLIDNIRTVAPETLILVSGWQWTYDLRGFYGFPVRRGNVAYVAHVYASHMDPREWEDSFGFLSEKYPIVITEWGFNPAAERTIHYYGTREGFGNSFLRYMMEKGFSWVAWCFHPSWQPNMIKSWNFDPTEMGMLVKRALMSDNNSPSVSITSPQSGSTVEGIVEIRGAASDDIGLLAVEIRIDNGDWQSVTHSYDPLYCEDSWSFEWETLLLPNGPHTITARALDLSGNVAVQSISVELANPVDETPPVVEIVEPSDGAALSGIVSVRGFASDESGIREIRISVDNNDMTSWTWSSMATTKENRGGLFFDAAVSADGEWSAYWDTTSVSDGQHTIDALAMDIFGNVSEDHIAVTVTNGDILASCDNLSVWSTYSGGGAGVKISQDTGVVGNAIKVSYSGFPGGWWGIVKGTCRDFSDYSALEFYIKGDSFKIRIQLEDSGRELWTYTLVPTQTWQKVTIPFEEIIVRPDWNALPGVRKDGVQDFEAVRSIQFIHTVEDQDAVGSFWVDDIRLIK